jgi:predicted lipoprotein with Yx(FWY)xxD motif
MNNTRECAGIRSQLGVYIIGAIAPEDRTAVVRHMAVCEPCREELAGLAGLPALLRRPTSQAAVTGPMPIEAGHVDGPAGGDNSRDGWPEPGGVGLGGVGLGGVGLGGAGLGGVGLGGVGLGRMVGGIVRRRRRRRWLLAAMVLALAAVAVTGWVPRLTGTSAAGPDVTATVLETDRAGPATVLTDAEGYTLYWYSSDTPDASHCTGNCAVSWPPVSGPAIAGDDVTGELGAITRPDGSLQATYDGHPLYTASKDMAPGQAEGDGVRDSGGVWHEVTVAGLAPPPAAGPSPSPSDSDGY